jgi:hypothetical protein
MRSITRRTFLTLGVCGIALQCASGPANAATIHVYGTSFGEPGSGSGQFAEPAGVAVNAATDALIEPAAGDVYVADKANNRVERFTAAGAYIGLFEAPSEGFSAPETIAVDDSGDPLDPSAYDVYVANTGHDTIDKFTPGGKFLGTITDGAGGAPFGAIDGVAVDATGSVWVYQASKEIDSYTDGEPNTFAASRELSLGTSPGFAVDSEDDLYANRGNDSVAKYSSSGGGWLIGAMTFHEGEVQSGVAVDFSDQDVYLPTDVEGTWSVAQFTRDTSCSRAETSACEHVPAGSLVERFGAGDIAQGGGIAVNSATGSVYVADRGASNVKVFAAIDLPTVTTGASSAQGETATVTGTVNPEGVALTECKFEYGTKASYGQSAPCVPAAGSIPADSSLHGVSADLSGLPLRTGYHYRLTAVNANGTTSGEDGTFFTSASPAVEAESVVSVDSTEASLTANLDAAGLPSTYRVEYGTTSAYGSSTPDVSLSASQVSVAAAAHLSGLAASTLYHFRYVAANALGTVMGDAARFAPPAPRSGGGGATSCPNRTFEGASATLPDCRAYELVSVGNPGEVYVPEGPNAAPPVHADVGSAIATQASAGGDAVVYVGEPGVTGGDGLGGYGAGNQFLAERSTADPGHWNVQTLTPQSETEVVEDPVFMQFSSDLSLGVLAAGTETANELSSSATPAGPHNCNVLFSHDAEGKYHALFTEAQAGFCGTFASNGRVLLAFAGGNGGTASVPEYSDLLVESPAAFTPQAQPVSESGEGGNLYDASAGQTYAVNVLPKGEPAPHSTFGASSRGGGANRPDLDDVISNDGSRIFWSDLDTTVGPENPAGMTRLFVREDPASAFATTVQIDVPEGGSGSPGGGVFWTASPDGSKVLFTDESKLTADSTAEAGAPNLYLYDFNQTPGSRLSDLTAVPGAAVQGVVGASNDGSYVYFVADGVLAANANSENATAEPRACEEAKGETPSRHEEELGLLPVGLGCNLYVLHDGETRFIAALAAKDDNYYHREFRLGDWFPELGSRTAQVTPDGRHLVFQSTQRLTHYDNSTLLNPVSRRNPEGAKPEYMVEVFVYDAEAGSAGRLICASCAPSGAPPVQEEAERASGAYLPINSVSTRMRRWVSEDGSRVFFDSAQPLVPQDSNGVQDVYEWESEGTRSCPRATSVWGGCVFLLSGGEGSDQSYFIDADPNGDNVFFTHRGQLSAIGSTDGKTDLFDARAEGGSPQSGFACTGTGCQGVPPAAPSFATPPSATFNGIGNFPAQGQPGKAVTKPLTRAQKLAKALAACRKVKGKNKRAVCQRRARKQYGSGRKSSTHSKQGRKS